MENSTYLEVRFLLEQTTNQNDSCSPKQAIVLVAKEEWIENILIL